MAERAASIDELAERLERLEALVRADPMLREIELGLDRLRVVWDRLGAPRIAERIVTVAGTNGKGSTVLAIEALALAAGLRTGVTLSPHLERVNERIRLDGRDVDDADFLAALDRIEAAMVQGDPVALTYFEVTVLAALLVMADARCALAVLEVGLGGRLDAVNLLACDIAVITAIDLDHQAWLGDDREAIGREKAGILRHAVPLVLADPAPPGSVLDAARSLDCPILEIEALDAIAEQLARRSARCSLHPASAAAALAVAGELALGVERDAALDRLAQLQLPGRLEQRVLDGVPVLLDVAHNPHAARSLAGRLGERSEDAPWHLVFGAYADKAIEDIALALGGRVASVRTVDTPGPRGCAGEDCAQRWNSASPGARSAANLQSALLDAHRDAADDGGSVLVCGSFTIVGGARRSTEEAAT